VITAPDVPIADLRPHPQNYRRHPADELAEIGRSIVEHGFFRNVVVARDNTILAGHGVVEAARLLGRDVVPVLRLDVAAESTQALKVLVADNELPRMAEVDDRALTEILRVILAEAETALAGTGFDEEQLAALVMVTRTAAEIADLDAAAEWIGLPGFEVAEPRWEVLVDCDNREDRDAFVAHFGVEVDSKRGDRRWLLHWPPRPRHDLSAVEFQ
jgi:ParB-like chromosome segregation protein Spo0J